MGTLPADGIPFVDIRSKNVNVRNEGGALTASSGFPPQGITSTKIFTKQEVDGHHRDVSLFGTQADKTKTQYSTVCQSPLKKVTTSDDKSFTGGLVSSVTAKVPPTAVDQPEIANKPISQRSTYNTGNRIVVRDSADDSLVGRKDNTGEIPGGES